MPARPFLDLAAGAEESQFHREIMMEKFGIAKRTLSPWLSLINSECNES